MLIVPWGTRITLAQRNTETAFPCMDFGLFALKRVSNFKRAISFKTGFESASNGVLNKWFSIHQAYKQLSCARLGGGGGGHSL